MRATANICFHVPWISLEYNYWWICSTSELDFLSGSFEPIQAQTVQVKQALSCPSGWTLESFLDLHIKFFNWWSSRCSFFHCEMKSQRVKQGHFRCFSSNKRIIPFPTISIPTNKKKRESAEEFRSSTNRARTTACSPRVLSVPCNPTILVWNKTHPMSDVSYNSPTKRKWWGLLGRMIVMKQPASNIQTSRTNNTKEKTTNVEEKSTSPNIEKKIKSFSKKVIFGWILVFNSRRVVVKMLVSYGSRIMIYIQKKMRETWVAKGETIRLRPIFSGVTLAVGL